VQREGLEYEFDLVGYMNEDHTFAVDKTRCSAYSEKAYTKPGPKQFAPFVEWLKGSVRPEKPAPAPIDTGGNPVGTQAAADYAAQQKIQELQTSGEIKRFFAAIREPWASFNISPYSRSSASTRRTSSATPRRPAPAIAR
jgi:hypothetical protein